MGDPGFADSEGKKSSPSSNYSSSSSHAPWYNVPKRSIVSVEHPFIIRNIEKGLKTLGNSGRLERVCHCLTEGWKYGTNAASVGPGR